MSVILAERLASVGETMPPASVAPGQKAIQCLNAFGTAAALGTHVSPESIRRRAHWETTKRVLAQAVNEGLAIGTIEVSTIPSLWLRAPNPEAIAGYGGAWIKCSIRPDAYVEMDNLRVVGFVRAEDLLCPVLSGSTTGEPTEELDPGVLCRLICSWQPELAGNDNGELLIKEVQNATENQGKLNSCCSIRLY